ncbi:MAG: hypothetical protein R2769_04210 [Saprospiraceae bacterium]
MTLEPKDVLERLEFDKILSITENECLSELGKAGERFTAGRD